MDEGDKAMLKEKGKALVKACKPGVAKVANWANKGEHPVHLVYFLFVATHSAYQLVAVVCLVCGLFAMIHITPTDEGDKQ